MLLMWLSSESRALSNALGPSNTNPPTLPIIVRFCEAISVSTHLESLNAE